MISFGRSTGSRPRSRVGACALAAALVVVASPQPGAHAAGLGKRPAVQPDHRIPSTPFVPEDNRAAVARGGHPAGTPRSVAWPAPAAADVPLAPAAGVAAGPAFPVSLRPAAPAAAAAPSAAAAGSQTAHVELLDHAAAARAGVTGVLLSVRPAQGSEVGAVDATLDYSAFAGAAGADFGGRLRLVSLPGCALTTPEVPACQVQTPIAGAGNDVARHTLSARIDLRGSKPPAASPSAPATATATTQSPMVLAATAGGSGSGGDFTATSLAPTGTWSVGGATGGFTWTYPIGLPPVAAGTAPGVALTYSSNEVDGRTATTNNQSSWVGEGWDYSSGYVERTYRTCSDQTDLPKASQTSDLCWAGQILTLDLRDRSIPLVYDDATHTLHEQSDDGDRVELLQGAANGALSGEYFKVTTQDGTQYFFGRGGGPGAGATNSTWTVPVFGAHSGDPCNSSSGFSSSSCTQGWRWNLDYVEDAHGNAAMYYYNPETNYYGKNNSTTGTSYIRGGSLSRIDYGLRDVNGTVYGSAAPDQVVFTVAERCVPTSTFTCDPAQMTTTNATKWPDVPVDQQCTSGTTCNVHSPTFWSTKRLTNITTQISNGSGGYSKVDSYDLNQSFPGDADPELWLNAITRTGYDGTGATLSLLPTSFAGQAMVNRVPNYNNLPGMPHWRLTSITGDTGSVTNVTYTTGCSTGTIPADASQNTSQCMPVYWTPQLYTAPILDYFNKFVVSEVDVQDPSALTPMKKTMYAYVGGAAWHYDDNEVVKPENRTWGQFRGYGEVDVRTGNASNGETLTKTATTYFRGMNGDTLPNSGKRSVSVTDSLGETVADDDALNGQAYEATTYNGDGGARLSRTITNPGVVATNGTRTRAGLAGLTADVVRSVKMRTLTDLAAGGVKTVTSVDTYDSLGRLLRLDEAGDGVPEICSVTSYAENTAAWIRDRVSEVVRSQQACPPAGTAQSTILADTRNYYDGSGTLGAVPGAGDPTRIDKFDNGSFFTDNTSTYDASGRLLTSADALGRTTSTVYSPADGGNVTQKKVTNPLNQTVTSVFNPDRGTKASATDIAGHVESATYDPLGRVTQVWKPGRTQGQVPPNVTYSYLVQAAGPDVLTENDLVDYGTGTNYVTTTKLYDTLGRLVQTQTAAENGGSQVSDSFYDGHGWTVATDNHYLISAVPSSTVRQVAVNAVDDRTVTTMDGSGRVTLTTSLKDGVPTKTTQTVYGGDRVTVIPPQGGTIQTNITDVRGRSVELDQYTVAPTVTGNVVSGGTFQPVTYGYDALGRLTTTAFAGSTWTSTLDTLGRVTKQTDPDSGTSTTVYDNAGQVSSTTDALNQTLAYAYDALGRKTALYSGSVSGTKLASWLYDTLQPGLLTNETRYTPSGNYVTGATGYDAMGNAVGKVTVIPAAETGLNGRYTTSYSYSSTGLMLTATPAPILGMPGEVVTTTYDKLGNAVGVNGTSVVASQTLGGYGQSAQITYGGSTNNAWQTLTYDLQTLKPTDVNLTSQTATPQQDDTVYGYDPAGHITSIKDTQGPIGAPVDDQCYGYDALARLQQAWTSAPADCSQNPSTLGGSTVGGPNPFWTTWTFDAAGDRATQSAHAVPGGPTADQTTTYAYNTAGGAHSLTGTTGGPGGSTGYTYNAAGQTLTRNLPGGSQSFGWNLEGRPYTATTPSGTTNWIYTADNSELVRRDPGSTTVYLPDQEVTRGAAGDVTAKRYYHLGTLLVAVSDGTAGGTEYLVGDDHDTQQLAVNTTTLALTRRSTDPYGNARGAVKGGVWPDGHGFLNKPAGAGTGLIDVGAREYDPVVGRFLSVDPVLNGKDPQTMSGYAYSGNDPTSTSDPSGLRRDDIDPADGGGSSSSDTGFHGDDWWNDPAMNLPMPKSPPKGLEHMVNDGGDSVLWTHTDQKSERWLTDMQTCIGCNQASMDFTLTITDSTSRSQLVTNTFMNQFGWNVDLSISDTVEGSVDIGVADGKNSLTVGATVGVNGQYQWTHGTTSNNTSVETMAGTYKVNKDDIYGFAPFGKLTTYTTTYVHKDYTMTQKTWAVFEITAWKFTNQFDKDHPAARVAQINGLFNDSGSTSSPTPTPANP